MEEEDQNMPPFWLQTNDTYGRAIRRRRSPSLFFSSGFFIILLLVIAFAFIFFVIPSFLSFTSQIFRPHLVRRGWDSLNLVLVLFAIVCGFLGRNNNNDNPTSSYDDNKFSSTPRDFQKANPSTPRQWYEYSDRTASNKSLSRLRSSNSYPDLRQESAWVTTTDDRWRCCDDTHLYNYRSSSSDQLYHRSRPEEEPKEDKEESGSDRIKDIDVDTFVTKSQKQEQTSYTPSTDQSPQPPLPSPPPPKAVKRKTKRTHQDLVPKSTEIEKADLGINISQPPAPPPPPKTVKRKTKRTYQDRAPKTTETEKAELGINISQQPPPPPVVCDNKHRKNEKGGGGTTKDFLSSLRRKKKQRQKSVENLEGIFNSQPSSYSSSAAIVSLLPPPPPPPPPPAFFHNLFSSKKEKTKKVHSIPSPPPPPPPPPPASLKSRASKIRAQVASEKPNLPVKVRIYNSLDQGGGANIGNESPLISIPRPPPPPPFKIPAWKFVVQGDYVRLLSINSSRSGSLDLDGVDEDTVSNDSGDSPMAAPLFCPSPDVDTKADNFIARFRAGLKLEKMNSVKEKQGRGKSTLGPELGPNSSPDTVEGEGTN